MTKAIKFDNAYKTASVNTREKGNTFYWTKLKVVTTDSANAKVIYFYLSKAVRNLVGYIWQ